MAMTGIFTHDAHKGIPLKYRKTYISSLKMRILSIKSQHTQRKTPHPSLFQKPILFCFIVNVQSLDRTSQGQRLQVSVQSVYDPFVGN